MGEEGDSLGGNESAMTTSNEPIRKTILALKGSALEIFRIGLFALLMGCVTGPVVEPIIPPLAVSSKIPLRVALVIPESTHAFSKTDHFGVCGGGGVGDFTAYGAVLEQSAKDIFSSLYEDVTLVRESIQGLQSDAILEMTMTKFSYKWPCPASAGVWLMPEGTFRAIDRRGIEVWRSQTTSRKLEIANEWHNTEEKQTQRISSAIANLVTKWAEEISRVPISQYAQTSPPRPGSSEVTPTTITPPPIY
jgi:hypothetical protein